MWTPDSRSSATTPWMGKNEIKHNDATFGLHVLIR